MDSIGTFADFGKLGLLCSDSIPTVLGLLDPTIAPPFLYYSYVPIIIISLIFGTFVFIVSRASLAGRLLLWIAIVFSLLVGSELLLWISAPAALVHFVWQITIIFHALLVFFLLNFTYTFVVKEPLPALWQSVIILFLLPVFVLAPSAYNLSVFDLAYCESVQGLLWPYMYAVETFALAAAFIFCMREGRRSKDRGEQRKSYALGIGIVLFFGIFILSNTLGDITLTYDINLIGPAGMIAFLATITFLIVRYHAFNTRVIGAQALVLAVIAFLFAALFVRTIDNARFILLGTLVLVGILGTFLIRGVRREIEQREHIEKLAAQLEVANERLKELDRMKSEFLSIASHQLRAPITAIKGYASLIVQGDYGPVPDTMKDPLERVSESARVMASSIEDYLNISRIEQGSLKYEFAPVDVASVAQKVVEEMRPVALAKHLALNFSSKDGALMVQADFGKIKQVFSNLVDNAIKYTKEGNVSVTAERAEGKIRVTIADTGIGIAKEDIEKLFAKFTRAKDANKINTTGTGLGLYVAKQLVEGHKGTIRLESEGLGKGARFVVELPV